jgi:hypothetical protein
LTLRELYGQIINTCVKSGVVTGIELLLLEEPILKLRAYLGGLAFIEVFFNEETGKTSFALIKDGERIFGADNTRGWHIHPFDNPESHAPCEETSFESFLMQTQRNKEKWERPHESEGTTR